MLKILKDSSEIREACDLLRLIMAEPPAAQPPTADQPLPKPGELVAELPPEVSDDADAVVVEQWVAVPGDDLGGAMQLSSELSRGDRLQQVLVTLCAHEGLAGALITDGSGLPVATSSDLAGSENLAAFSTVLGDALHKAGSYLGQDDASDVALDINARQKVVLRRFALEGRTSYLLVLCATASDPRTAMREAIPEIVTILAVA
jgi:predicted regulator of Ras-like GTPase activity (Roadblock/LC7/MglB family)